MRRALPFILIAPLLGLAGCGEEPQVSTYESARPASYVWPKTEAREAEHTAGGIDWVWQVPAGWVDAPEVPDQLIADYRFKGVNETLPGRLTLSMIPGEAGGVMANVTRWQKQLFVTEVRGLGPRDRVSESRIGPTGTYITIVELAGQYQGPNTPTHLLGAIIQVRLGERVLQSWFMKMVGDKPTIDDNRQRLETMILSFRPKGFELPEGFLSPDASREQPEAERPFLARPLDQPGEGEPGGDPLPLPVEGGGP